MAVPSPQLAARLAADSYRPLTHQVGEEVRVGTEYCQVVLGNGIYVPFRGSDDVKDWASNLDQDLASHPRGGCVHKGFLRGYDALAPALIRVLADYPREPLHLIGHSRGGALALIAAVNLPFEIGSVTVFGCPRAGDKAFAALLSHLPVVRYENRTFPVWGFRDPVPHLPVHPAYHHAGKVVYLTALGRPSSQHSMQTYLRSVHATFGHRF